MSRFLCATCAQVINSGDELPVLAHLLEQFEEKEPVIMVDGTIYCLAHVPPVRATTRRVVKK
jgi:hypothetical protein